jgi:hypothetical protein
MCVCVCVCVFVLIDHDHNSIITTTTTTATGTEMNLRTLVCCYYCCFVLQLIYDTSYKNEQLTHRPERRHVHMNVYLLAMIKRVSGLRKCLFHRLVWQTRPQREGQQR